MVYTEKKGRHWVPLLIMVILAVCCTGLFYAVPLKAAEPDVRITSRNMPWFTLENGVLYFDKSKYSGDGQLVIPDEIDGTVVTSIGEGCFQDCTALTSVFLPETLEAIGENAFRSCTALRGIEIPESVLFVGKNAFEDCTALEAVCISNKLQQIGSESFDGCTRLHFIYFLGKYQEWTSLYRGFLDPNVVISCEDGKFYQSGDPA